MLAKTCLAALALAPAALAAPLMKKDDSNFGVSDPTILVLQFAATLEALEYTYYAQGLEKFNATDLEAAGFSANLSSGIQAQLEVFRDDEKAHSSYIDGALTDAGFDLFWQGCSLDFTPALGSVLGFAGAARIFEQVGVGAYIGAAPLLDKQTLIAASTIATVEARHSSFLNLLNGGDYAPSPYDISLAPSAVATLVSPYVSNCSFAEGLGIAPGTPLGMVVEGGSVVPGANITFTVNGAPQVEGWCHIICGGVATATVYGAEQCHVPMDAPNGPLYVYLSGSEEPLVNNAAAVDLSSVFAGPALTFVDNKPLSLIGLY